MKRDLFIVICVLAGIFVSCTSDEKKANKLIKQYMFENLYDYESYQPTKTQIDTLYYDIYLDSDVISAAYQAYEYLEDAKEYKEKADYAKNEADMFKRHFGSSIMRGIHMDEYKNNMSKFNEKKLEALKNMRYILDMQAKSEDFEDLTIGWKVTHKFRCNNRGGNLSLGEYIFFIDRDFTEIFETIVCDEDYEISKEIINVTLQSDRDAILAEIESLEK